MNFDQFIQRIVPELINDKISVRLERKSTVEEGTSGSFDSTAREFIVAAGSKLRFDIAVHEYCHYIQYRNDRPFWNKHSSGCNDFFTWIDNKNKTKAYSSLEVDRYYNHALNLELDCESRAVDMIRDMSLEIDIINYIKNANAYLFSYSLVRERRQWPKRSVYIPSISNHMPEFLLTNPNQYKIGSLQPKIKRKMELQFV